MHVHTGIDNTCKHFKYVTLMCIYTCTYYIGYPTVFFSQSIYVIDVNDSVRPVLVLDKPSLEDITIQFTGT